MSNDKLAERQRFEEWYTTHAHNYSINPIGSRDCSLQWESWKAALATHSAQAQPNIPDLTDEEWEILFHFHPELKARLQKVFDAHDAQAQPPAASVTDAIARRMVAEYDAVLCGDPTATRTDGMRAALEAALAAQENPNV